MNTEYKTSVYETQFHIGFCYTYCVLCADVLSSVFIICDFCVLTFEFHVLSFPFCVLCYVFFFRRRVKDICSSAKVLGKGVLLIWMKQGKDLLRLQ